MTALAPVLEAFFTSRLINEKGVSPHTIAATVHGPGTRGWRRSTRCSATPRCVTPSTLR